MDWWILFSEDTISITPPGRPRRVRRVWVQTVWNDTFYVDIPYEAFSAEAVKATIEAEMEEYRKLHGIS